MFPHPPTLTHTPQPSLYTICGGRDSISSLREVSKFCLRPSLQPEAQRCLKGEYLPENKQPPSHLMRWGQLCMVFGTNGSKKVCRLASWGWDGRTQAGQGNDLETLCTAKKRIIYLAHAASFCCLWKRVRTEWFWLFIRHSWSVTASRTAPIASLPPIRRITFSQENRGSEDHCGPNHCSFSLAHPTVSHCQPCWHHQTHP